MLHGRNLDSPPRRIYRPLAVRETHGWLQLDGLAQDLRYAVRSLLRRPGFAAVAVLVLSVGIGVNTAVFSLVNAVLLRPLPAVRAPQELLYLYSDSRESGLSSLTYGDYLLLREETAAFTGMFAVSRDRATLRSGRETRPVNGECVSANYFDVLGVSPVIGRPFGASDDDPGADPVGIISHRLWMSRYHSDKAILGKPLDLDMPRAAGLYGPSKAYTIVGVAAPDFRGTGSPWEQADYWVPLAQRAIDAAANWPGMTLQRWPVVAVGRLRPGIPRQRAEAGVTTRQEALREAAPWRAPDWRLIVLDRRTTPLPFDSLGRVVPARLAAALLAVSAILLMIAATNLTGLLMARAVSRSGEIAIRLSLGAGRWRVVRQLLVESQLLSAVGGGCALLCARLLLRAFVAQIPGRWQFSTVSLDVPLDGRVLAFTAAVCVASGIVVGVMPALRSARTDVIGALAGGTGATPRKARLHLRQWILIPQVCLSLVLLLVAGACASALLQAEWDDPGYDADHVVLVDYQLPEPDRATIDAIQAPGRGGDTRDAAALRGAYQERRRFVQRTIIEHVSALPELSAAGLAFVDPNGVPLPTSRSQVVALGDYPRGPHHFATRGWVSPGYFDALGIQLLRGRLLDARDDTNAARVAVVSDTLARTLWPGRDPVGERLAQHEADSAFQPRWLEVVGVVRDVRRPLSDGWSEPAYYVPIEQHSLSFGLTVVARGQGNPARLIEAVKGAVGQADGSAVTAAGRTMEEALAAALYPRRMAASVLGVSGLSGLLLACVGIYGVLSYSVAQRVREMGIRAALGATRTDIIRLLLVEGLRILVIGAALGLVLAKGALRLTSNLVVALPALDWLTFVTVPLVLAAIVCLACYLPARRAARTDPMVSLRTQ